MFKNHVDLIGFIGSDPEQRQLENGAQLTSLSLATKTSWKNDSGSYDKLDKAAHPCCRPSSSSAVISRIDNWMTRPSWSLMSGAFTKNCSVR